METTGKIIRIENVEQITEKFKKRKLIVEYANNPSYPQTLEFTLIQDNVNLADKLNPGDEVKLLFDLKGREAIDKNSRRMVFNTLEVWRIEVLKKSIDYLESASSQSKDNVSNTYSDNEPLPF